MLVLPDGCRPVRLVPGLLWEASMAKRTKAEDYALLVEVLSPGRSAIGVGVAEELCPWGFVLREFRPLPLGGWLRVRLHSGPASMEPLEALARVAWFSGRTSGIELVPERDGDRARIDGWLANFQDECSLLTGRYVPFRTRVTRLVPVAAA